MARLSAPQEYTLFGRTFRVGYWRNTKVWYVIELDAAGNQVGDAIDAPDRDHALIYAGIEAARTR